MQKNLLSVIYAMVFKNKKTTLGGLLFLAAFVLLKMKNIDQATFMSLLALAGTWLGITGSDSSKRDIE